jgi:TonB family protein
MQRSTTYKLIRNSFWVSLLLHLLLVLSMCTYIVYQPEDEPPKKSPHYFVPSYVYTGSIKPAIQRNKSTGTQSQSVTENTEMAENTESSQKSASELSTETPQSPENIENTVSAQGTLQVQKKLKSITTEKKKPIYQKSMLAASLDMLKQNQLNDISKTKSEDPIYLVGDDSEPADPLVKLLGRSLSAHFSYPHMAGEFGIRGKVIVELTLHPGGYFTDVQMLRSSTNQDLDAAALYAVNSAPTVIGANRYITQPKHFVIGFVFY